MPWCSEVLLSLAPKLNFGAQLLAKLSFTAVNK